MNDLEAYEFGGRFIESVLKPLVKKYPYEYGKELNISVRMKPRDTHFFERVIERGIDKGRLGSLFKKLISDKYCELIYLFHRSRMVHKMDEEKLFILVTYKDLSVIFMMCDGTDGRWLRWELVPLTILKNNDKFEYNYRIDL